MQEQGSYVGEVVKPMDKKKGFSKGTCTVIAAYLKVVNTVVGCLSAKCTLFNTILVLFHMLVHMIICLQ